MAYSKKLMGKEVGDASVYAAPHTMDGKSMKIKNNPGKEPNRSNVDTVNMSVGTFTNRPEGNPTKTSGIKIRGTGAATKGIISRGPMA
jgi:hypothetical protein